MLKTEKVGYIVIAYVRVSTENQLENYSIDEQIERIKAYCKAKGWILLKIYTDGGYSGGNTDRPGLQQMLQDIRGHVADAIVVYKLDRLSRSQKDTLTLIEDEFLANKTDFISINENFDTSTPFGRAMIGILSVFAQLEKDQITERFTMGRIGRCKAGYFHGGGNIPLGYRYENGLLIVDECKAIIVRQIFSMFLSGKSINAIMRHMERTYGGKWSAAKIAVILRNNVYIGKVKFAGQSYDGVHQPLVSVEDYCAANSLLDSAERKNAFSTAQKTPFRADTLLSGLLFCARCGARYAGNHGYYKCYSRAKSSRAAVRDPNCKNDHWHIEDLDAIVINAIRELLHDPEQLRRILEDTENTEPVIDTAAIEKRLHELDAQIAKLVDLYQISAIPMEMLTTRIGEIKREVSMLKDELAKAETALESPSDSFRSAVDRFRTEFDGAPLETRRLLVASLIKAIYLDGKETKIDWRI